MKPTLEQIKTDESVWPKGATVCAYNHPTDNHDFMYRSLEYFKGLADSTMLIPRPTKAFVPEVGVACEGLTTDAQMSWVWEKVEPLKETSGGEFACLIYFKKGQKLRFVDQFRPIKSEREKFIEEAESVIKAHQWTPTAVIEDLYDSGKFKLVELVK